MKKCILFLMLLALIGCSQRDVTSYDDVLQKEGFGFSLTNNQLDRNIRSAMADSTVPTFYFKRLDNSNFFEYELYVYGKFDGRYSIWRRDEKKIILKNSFESWELSFDDCKQLVRVMQVIFSNDSLKIPAATLIYDL